MKNYILKEFGSIFLILIVIVILLLVMKSTANALAGISVGNYFLEKAIVVNKEIQWTPEMELARIKALQEKNKVKPVKVTQKVSKPVLPIKEVKIDIKGNCTSKVRTDLVNHAYLISNGDMKFLGTISSESMWDVGAVGDAGKSFGLCQIHRGYNPSGQKAYKALKTDKEKLEYCYKMYKTWNDKGIVENRLYGSRVWKKGIEKVEINCK